jgi:hypothetical protein
MSVKHPGAAPVRATVPEIWQRYVPTHRRRTRDRLRAFFAGRRPLIDTLAGLVGRVR